MILPMPGLETVRPTTMTVSRRMTVTLVPREFLRLPDMISSLDKMNLRMLCCVEKRNVHV